VGIGKVLEVSQDEILVFFEDGPATNPVKVVPSMIALELMPSTTSRRRLDHLPPLHQGSVTAGRSYFGPTAAVARFLQLFPDGFSGTKFHEMERDYKWRAHEEAVNLLGKKQLEQLIAKARCGEIADRAMRVIGKVNLLAPFEQAAFRDGVKDGENATSFGHALFDVLHGTDPYDVRFKRYAQMLARLPQRKSRQFTWPNQTILQFLYDPQTRMFMKPAVTKQAAERFAFPLRYDPEPQWPVYERLMQLSHILMDELADFRPRDFIDVQSFIWCIGDDSYKIPATMRRKGG